MRTGTHVFLAGCLLIGFAFTPASADERRDDASRSAGRQSGAATIDWIDAESHKIVADDRVLMLSPVLRVYSADGRLMSPKSLKKGMKVRFDASRLPNAPHPVVREIRVVSQP